jgi:hypothetical protein
MHVGTIEIKGPRAKPQDKRRQCRLRVNRVVFADCPPRPVHSEEPM